jgi:ABC-2 type transport system permease protein
MTFFTAFTKEILEQRRTRRLMIAVVILFLFGMTSPLIAKILPQFLTMLPGGEEIAKIIPAPTLNDAVAQYIKNIAQFGVLLALLFGMGAVAVEKDKGTAAMILSKPLPRSSFLLAKFASVTVTFVMAIVLAGAAAYYYTYYLFGLLPILPWLAMNGLILVYMMVYYSITLLFSTLTKNQFVAIGLSFGALILLGIFGSLPGIKQYFPDSLIANGGTLAIGGTPESWIGLWVSLGLIVVLLFGTWMLFRKQEL